MNKSQGRPKRTQREQTLSFGATMHDFSKWSGLAVLQPKQKNITGNLFSKIIRAVKRRFLCCLLTMIKDGWVRKNNEKVAKDANYIPRTEKFRKTI